ncbi:hypothetical protein P170DRAFT_262392 [Aspergillus steynii IBT 23096]|uniref:Uncharacterized protein n=1 Tax=Aspergillus steynii IBT 23096 TaxID=1392250 RepID=A0A2I2FZX4_9EURO|nr:uncharacterized protein P170DRAFT_262392 [Aspergillus steynii IBT 23096]PLB46180.1 hypothetical protein P170DRAFT_262392 [Aspergillus steynii IBT 23096]
MNTPTDQVPPGWTNEPARLRGLFYPGSGESQMARSYGLTDFNPLLFNTPDTGEMGYILQSGEEFYWGDLMIDYIFLITKPKTLEEFCIRLPRREIKV